MRMFELLPRPLGNIFRNLTHLACNSSREVPTVTPANKNLLLLENWLKADMRKAPFPVLLIPMQRCVKCTGITPDNQAYRL